MGGLLHRRAATAAAFVALLVTSGLVATTVPVLAVPSPAPATAASGPSVATVARASGTDRHDRSSRVDLARDAVRGRAGLRWRWRGDRLRFWSGLAADYDWSLQAAVKAWNRTGLDMRLVRVRSRKRAQVLVLPVQGWDMSGEFTVQLGPGGRATRGWIRMSRAVFRNPEHPDMQTWQLRAVMAQILAHEFGHVLGIGGHEPARHACGLMEAVHDVEGCPNLTEPGVYRCGMVDSWALKRLVRLYGGRKRLGRRECPILPVPPRLAGVSIDGGAEVGRPVTVRWTPTASRKGRRVELVVAPTCAPWVRDDFGAPVWDERNGEVHLLDPAAGTWTHAEPEDTQSLCYSVRLVNRAGSGRSFVSAQRTAYVPPPPAPAVVSVEPGEWFGSPGFHVDVVASSYRWSDDELEVFVDPRGGCRSSVTFADVLDNHTGWSSTSEGVTSAWVSTELVDPCLTLVAVRYGPVPPLVSPVTAYQVP